uniref:RRM domain-containing protein n=1 Tax=Sinocyclocheilus rhinocerous TaxID=307959 RepID=A0A673L976_9TELE
MATSYNWSLDEDNGQPKVQGSLLINDLHSDVTEQVLHTIFQPFGPIRSVKVCRGRRTNRSRGNGFVTFEQRHDAENALVALNFLELMGKPVRIPWAQSSWANRCLSWGAKTLRHNESSSSDRQVIDWTESIERSWGRRLANTVKSYFKTVMSSPDTLLGISLLTLACTESFIKSL